MKTNSRQKNISLPDEALAIIREHSRGRVLELGTGTCKGTEAALVNGESVVTVDHVFRFTTAAFARYDGDPRVFPLYMPLEGKTYSFNDFLHEDIQFNTIIVDGPIGTETRDATLGAVIPMLAKDGKLIVHDSKRDWAIIHKWANHFGLEVQQFWTPKGTALLEKKQIKTRETEDGPRGSP